MTLVSTNIDLDQRVEALHSRATLIDGRDPTFLLYRQTGEEKPQYWDTIAKSGLTAICVDVPMVEDTFREAAINFAAWHDRAAAHPETTIIRSAADVERAKQDGVVGFILTSQSPTPVENNVRLVRALWELGLRSMEMAYQKRNLLADGCGETNDAGLSKFGVEVIHEMNRLGMAIDLSHASDKTMIQTIEESEQPVYFSHSNPRALVDNPRNVTDAYLKRLVEKGGMCCASAYADFIQPNGAQVGTRLEHYVKVIDYLVNLIGIDHVGIGFDVGESRTPAEVALIGGGDASKRYVQELMTRSNLRALTRALVERGYKDDEVEKIMGRNLLEFFRTVWRG